MILFIEDHTGRRTHYNLNSEEAFEPIFDLYPRTRQIAEHSWSHEEAAKKIARYLSNGYNKAWVETGELNKALRDKAAAAGLAIAAMMAPTMLNNGESPVPQARVEAPSAPKYETKAFGQAPEDAFLWAIKQNESSGGIDTDHALIQHGPQRGQKALGRWGLLPNTVHELLRRKSRQGKLHPEVAALASMNHEQMNEAFKANPHLELGLARSLASHVIKKQKGDQSRAAYSWLFGHNKDHESITNDMLEHDYVKKFKEHNKKNPYVKMAHEHLNQIIKSQPDFKKKLYAWQQARQDQGLQRQITSSESLDIGRTRPQELDDLDVKPTDLREKIKASIKDAKAGNPRNRSSNN